MELGGKFDGSCCLSGEGGWGCVWLDWVVCLGLACVKGG